jgi:hypothetical protein
MRFGLLYEAQRPFEGASVEWNALYKEAGVDEVILIMQTETIPHEQAMRSIEMFGTHVIPACRAEKGASPIPAAV